MQTLIQDLRYGIRMLGKNPAFTAMAVLSLALGIGANAAIFSLLDAMLLKRLPVQHPEQLVFLETGEKGFKPSSNISFAAFEHLNEQREVISGLSFFSYTTRVNASLDGQTEVVEGQPVSGSFFSVLGVDPVAGRTFTEADDRPGSQAVAIISYGYWQRGFGGSQSAVGKTIELNRAPVTIIGVAPADFFGVIVGNAPDVFLPSAAADQILSRRFSFRDSSLPFVLARLKPGIAATQAGSTLGLSLQRSSLQEAGTELTDKKRQAIEQQTMRMLPASQGISVLRQQFSQPLRLLMAFVGLVLLIACANVANLLLARAATRKKEIALRLALGAGRLRLIRQLLTEALLLTLIGGAAGLLLASWSSGLLLAVVSSGRNPVTAGTRLSLNAPLDGRIVVFTVIVSLIAAVLFGLVPAWRATRLELSRTLKDNSAQPGGSRRFGWGRTLVVAQVAISVTLLVVAGLFVRSLGKLKSVDTGFERENVLLFSVDPQLIGYQKPQIGSLYKQMLERIAAVPGVRSVSLGRQGLLSGGGTQGSIRVPGHEPVAGENSLTRVGNATEWNAPYFSQVGPAFFETLGMHVVRGRGFNDRDNESAPKVAVINEAFARYYFGTQDPVGQRFDRGADDGGLVEIVGLVKDAKAENIREQTPRSFYVPFLQDTSSWRETTFQVRAAGEPLDLVGSIRQQVAGIDPQLPIFRVRTLDAQVDESLGQDRLVATLSSLFGILALLLASAGLYGVLSYSVSRRTQEIGIRMALGANRVSVLRMILRQGMTLTLVGVVLGLGGAFVLTRYLESLTTMLYGVRPTDPLAFGLAATLLTTVALLACLLPARRATKVDPLVALRYE